MKATMSSPSRNPLRHTAFKAAACAATLAALLALATSARAQTDNFDSGTENPAAGWGHISDPNYPATYTFPTDALGGHAYRLQGAVPVTATNGSGTLQGLYTARVLALCTNQSYTDFYVASDLVNWNASSNDDTNYQLMGLLARCAKASGGGNPNLTVGTNWDAVAMFYWVNIDTQKNPPGPSTGAFGLGYIVNGNIDWNFPTTDGGILPSGVVEWTLEPGHSYRMTFQGVGKDLTGKVYDLNDLTTPLGTTRGDTTVGTQTLVPLTPAPTSGWSGICALSSTIGAHNGDGRTNTLNSGVADATFDNFYAAVTPPTSVSAPATPYGLVGAPQVINRTPASWANFYSPAGGISFTATTLTTTNALITNAIRLILNGVDVSASLNITPTSPATSATVTFSGLASNTVYDAAIILQDSYNRRTTNVWTFDTFSDAYLASATCKNIECEDYDIGGGGYFPFPVPASGFSTNDNTWYTPPPFSFSLNYGYGINLLLGPNVTDAGYAGLKGNRATTYNGDGDYYECDRTGPLVGQIPDIINLIGGGGGLDINNLFPGCEYRTGGVDGANPPVPGNANGDVAGTEEGAYYGISLFNLSAVNTLALWNKVFDTKRAKYAALNAAGLAQYPDGAGGATGSTSAPWWDVEEYVVCATEGSDWFNYTHDWGTVTNSYNIYLRHACGASEVVNLYLGATTNRATQLGTFYCTNALMWNFRYAPLLDATGKPAVVQLGNPTDSSITLRMEIDPSMPRYASIRRQLALNYLSFVPATCVQVTINPPEAVAAGAQWAVDGGPWYNSGALVNTTPGSHTVSFKPCHWSPPTDQIVTVTQDQTTSTTGTYVSGPSLWSTTQLKKSGTSWTREWNAIVDTANNVVTNTLPATSTYYQLRWDINTKVTKVSKAGTKLILNFTNTVFVTNNLGYQAGLNIRAWPGTSGTPIEGTMFDFGNPSPVPTDSTPFDAVNFPNGLATIGYATQSINMDGSGPKEHFSATNNCGVAAPGPFPVGYSQYYAVEYRGLLSIATAGNYRFATTSDDGSALWIDAGVNPTYAQAIVQNNYPQGMTTRSNNPPINLTADYHDIIVRFNQGVGGNGLQLQWDPTGGANFVPIPGSLFYHRQSVIITNGP